MEGELATETLTHWTKSNSGNCYYTLYSVREDVKPLALDVTITSTSHHNGHWQSPTCWIPEVMLKDEIHGTNRKGRSDVCLVNIMPAIS
ncbi:hypothetical protein EVAR_18045_1 [Eumeta japonica]|uniref:Uncharacterized protein n=1 Tax=Eumeta variegata TaxID=151549 RepID=A0A4C1XUZ4_EUMVA|nr:hypothetical protein EVAR_18045_1 [Eumeta japonica]